MSRWRGDCENKRGMSDEIIRQQSSINRRLESLWDGLGGVHGISSKKKTLLSDDVVVEHSPHIVSLCFTSAVDLCP